jgi:hypothetical protein
LLIKPSDIGRQATADGPPIPNPGGLTGVGQTFRNPDGKRTIVDTIAVYPDPSGAAPMIPAMKDELGRKITGAPQPVDIGSNGFTVAGVAADPSKQMEISEAVFTEGRTLVDFGVRLLPGQSHAKRRPARPGAQAGRRHQEWLAQLAADQQIRHKGQLFG